MSDDRDEKIAKAAGGAMFLGGGLLACGCLTPVVLAILFVIVAWIMGKS